MLVDCHAKILHIFNQIGYLFNNTYTDYYTVLLLYVTKLVIRRFKSQDRQYNSQTKRDNNDLQNSAAKTNAWTNTNSIKILDFYEFG